MPNIGYMRGLNRALGDEMARDETVFLMGEDIRHAITGLTAGLWDRFGDERVIDMPLSEQAFTLFAMGAAICGQRPVVEYQISSLLYLTLEQIGNEAHKASLMSGGMLKVPAVYLLPASGSRPGWAGQHSDHPYSIFAQMGLKTLVPATPSDAYGLLVSAIRDDDPVVYFAPAACMGVRENVTYPLEPVPIGKGRVHREGTDITVVAVGHLVQTALAVAEQMADEVSIEVFDPRTVHPFDWQLLAASVGKTGRLVVIDDGNRSCGLAAEVLAVAAEEFQLLGPPKRVTRPDGAVLPFAVNLDVAVQPNQDQLRTAIQMAVKARW